MAMIPVAVGDAYGIWYGWTHSRYPKDSLMASVIFMFDVSSATWLVGYGLIIASVATCGTAGLAAAAIMFAGYALA